MCSMCFLSDIEFKLFWTELAKFNVDMSDYCVTIHNISSMYRVLNATCLLSMHIL